MESTDPIRAADEIERLSRALDAETESRLELQRQVDRANAEVEAFVCMAAHNLRESLREVASFSQLMAANTAGRLDSDADSCLDHIQQGADRMESLLTDIVDYWAAGARAEPQSPTDMEAVLRQALLRAEKQITGRQAIVTHDPLPPVSGDFEILAKVLHHLIRNAIEYCHVPAPRVHISSRWEAPDWVFSVHDNGPGVDPAFQGRIFAAFKRLHGREYPGNGLGLAFCRKAIEGCGGRIWVESRPGGGSTFLFSLSPAS